MIRPRAEAGARKGPVAETAIARDVVKGVLDVPGVASMSPGVGAEVSTLGPGERVRGVRVRSSEAGITLEVHVVAALAAGPDATPGLPALAERIRRAIADGWRQPEPLRSIHITFDDVVFHGKGRA